MGVRYTVTRRLASTVQVLSTLISTGQYSVLSTSTQYVLSTVQSCKVTVAKVTVLEYRVQYSYILSIGNTGAVLVLSTVAYLYCTSTLQVVHVTVPEYEYTVY